MVSQFDKTFNQIIVIGNGFDLACGLNSGYDDFFNSLFTDNPDAKNNVIAHDGKIINNPVNIWDIIFFYAKNEFKNKGRDPKNTQWQDVEKIIKQCVSEKGIPYYQPFHPDVIFSRMKYLEDHKYSTVSDDDDISLEIANKLMMDKHDLFNNVKEDASKLRCFYSDDSTGTWGIGSEYWSYNSNAVARAYLEELYSFENEFKGYLQEEIHSKYSSYTKNAKNLYLNISNLCDTYPDGKDNGKDNGKDKRDFLLSFNYTTPLLDLIKKDDKELADRLWVQKNIHGTVDTHTPDHESSIIFGIDGFNSKGERDNNINQMFSKSYRKLNLEEQPLPAEMDNPRRTLFYPISSNAEIHCIKIFGHSFGEADYSYFREIFDSVNLIHGKTVLYILYTEGHKPNPTAIYRLLDRYSDEIYHNGAVKSTTRIDLLQKLLMEDRIRLREIASPSSNCATTSHKGDGLKES